MTCGLALVTEATRQRGLDDSRFGAEASYVVDPEDGTRFEKVSIEFVLAEVDDDTAKALLKSFTDVCPIYNTVARDTRVADWMGAVLEALGMESDAAARSARRLLRADEFGIHTHGLARFPTYVRSSRPAD